MAAYLDRLQGNAAAYQSSKRSQSLIQATQPFPVARNLPQMVAISKVTGRDSGNKRQLVASKNWSIMQKQGSIVPFGAETTAAAGLSEMDKRSHAAGWQTQHAPFAEQL